MKDVAFCVKTFDRPHSVARLVDSILERYPGASLHLADDGRSPVSIRGANTIRLPFDSGISVGRNRLVDQTREPFLLFHDDDFAYGERTKVEGLLEILLRNPQLEIVAGAVDNRPGGRWSYEGWLSMEDAFLEHRPDRSPLPEGPLSFKEVGTFMNFMLVRRSLLDRVRWDEELKVAEHVSFLVDFARASGRAAFAPSVVVEHHHVYPADYARYRLRAPHYEALGLAKRGFREFVDYWGQRISIPPLPEAREAVRKLGESMEGL